MESRPRRRQPGRPRLDPEHDSVNVSFRLSVKEYDETYQRAQQARESLVDFVRKQLRRPEPLSER